VHQELPLPLYNRSTSSSKDTLMKRVCVLCLMLCIWIASCASQNGTPDPDSAARQTPAAHPELQNPAIPADVDPELYRQLVEELQSVLEEQARHPAATATDADSAVELSWDEAQSELLWQHHMKGDYDLNGEVNLADITPIAKYFGEIGPFPEGSKQREVDGDGNGEINIADVTPIGLNYRRLIVGYRVYSSNSGDDYSLDPPAVEQDPLQQLTMGDAVPSAEGLPMFTLPVVPDSAGHFFWVRPTDGTESGIASNLAGNGRPPTAALSVNPWLGQPLGADFDASASASPLALTLTYEYDYDGDGSYDYSGPDNMVSSPLDAPGSYTAKLQVTDTNGSFATVQRQYLIADVGGGVGELDRFGGQLILGDVMVEAIPGSVLGKLDITAFQTDLPPGLPESFSTGSPACRIQISDDDLLNMPLLLTLPYDDSAFGDESNVFVLYFDEKSGWMPTTPIALDTDNDRITVDSRRFGTFVVGWFDVSKIPGFLQHDLPFDPDLHGWNINNFGNFFSPNGNCLGMAGYCQWFYTEGPPEILNGKFSAAGGNPTSIAHLLAARTHLAQSQGWAFDFWGKQMALPEGLVGLFMKINISVFEDPLVLLLGTNGAGQHASVVYKYSNTDFTFYDVNAKDTEQSLPFTGASGFGNYGGYNSFGFVASPSFGRAEDFAHLTTEAENGFASSQDIQLLSPTFNQSITSSTVNLTGNLLGGLNELSTVIAYVNGVQTTIPVSGGSFTGNVPINKGANSIIIMAGTMSQSDWKRNGATLITSVTGTDKIYKFSIYNSWLSNLSDLDLYVIEPGGVPVWPGDPRSNSLLELGLENDNGYGPEQLGLSTEAGGTLLDGEYLVRVHYRQDLGDLTPTGGVDGNATILLNQGQPDQKLWFIPYSLSSDNPDNIAGDGVGPDWVDIATIDAVNGIVTLLSPQG
jgi:uncharacterized protein YfaP (DUF2135 family)